MVDNRPLEARADVLTYTTPPLSAALEALGPVHVELWVRAGIPHVGRRRNPAASLAEA